MSATPCPSCDRPMNAAAVVCPHCGARRPGAEVGLAGKGLSKEEVNALIAVHGTDPEPAAGLLPTLILPHPTTHGTARAVELACTVIALPMVIVGAVTVGMGRRRGRRAADQTSGELVPVLAMSGLGGLGFYSVLTLAGLAGSTALAVVSGSIVALIVRGVVRSRATNARRRDLDTLAKPEPAPKQPKQPKPRPSRPQLPEARVERSRPSAPVIAPPRPVEPARSSNPDDPPPDEPSLLK